MNAVISTSEQAAIRASNAEGAVYTLPRVLRQVFKVHKQMEGRYEQWSQPAKDLRIGDHLLAQPDIESQLGDALLRLLVSARDIAQNLQNGDDMANGKILNDALRAEFDTLMTDVIDRI